MRQIAKRIGALVGYVRQEFAGREARDSIDMDPSAQTVRVAMDDGLLLLTASFEFLSENSPLKWEHASKHGTSPRPFEGLVRTGAFSSRGRL